MINGTLPPECKIRLKMVYREFFLFVSFLLVDGEILRNTLLPMRPVVGG
ncbi:hypothetical protein SAMN05878482_101349 [Peribacillus simplex]|uniref:Uncharacterized protein n=1 Tax=Peribacillus simplex TaxID=1478 RepID=A0A9X8R2A2_9BACI|nr:hypothetical protein SAMN05878482_101349 [Peribacillus simplex]